MVPNSILLVEDNSDDEYLATRTLQKAGIRTISVARDGQEALTMLMAPDRPLPDLLIIDLRLPKVDGLQVMAALRGNGRTRGLPILALSSSEDPHDREACQRLGVRWLLGKPLDLIEFQQALNSL